MTGAARIRHAADTAIEQIEMARLIAKSALKHACRPEELDPAAKPIRVPVDLYQGTDRAWLDNFVDELMADA